MSEGNKEFGRAHSLWLSRKKGERESSSGSGEEREGATVCSAPARKRRGVRGGWGEGGRGVRGEENCVAETKTMWQVGEELRKRGINSRGEEKEIHLTAKKAEETYRQWGCCRH